MSNGDGVSLMPIVEEIGRVTERLRGFGPQPDERDEEERARTIRILGHVSDIVESLCLPLPGSFIMYWPRR